MKTIHEIVRDEETNYLSGTAQISKYVSHSMADTLDRVDAYLNSVHISGETDALGRDKPFFDIVTAAANVWFRATDIDRSNIKIRATKSVDYINSFVATIMLQEWMRVEDFGTFLNRWGRTLSRYGSAVVKTVENSSGLHISVVPWNRLIVDQVDITAQPIIEIIELSESQLRERVDTHGYDVGVVDALCSAQQARQNKNRTKKDNVNEFIKLYEVHGRLPKFLLTKKEEDKNIYVNQMHVISFVATGSRNNKEYEDFSLISGQEEKSPYRITHLIEEDGRTLSIGAVEHLFQAQWMQNHSMKAMKDQLDLAGKIIFQTADQQFIGRNAITDIENGDIFVHNINMPLTQMNNATHDLVSWQNYAVQWKQLGNEINGISEAMLGATPKSGTAWRQTEAVLNESHSLFELMTENKGLYIEQMLREDIIPYFKKKLLNNTKEVVAILDTNGLHKIDSVYVKAESVRVHNKAVVDDILSGVQPTSTPEMQAQQIRSDLSEMGNTRFLKPSEISDKTWKEQFKNLEWDVEIDVTGEAHDVQSSMATLNTALQVAANPQFAQNKTAQVIVGKILELTGVMSAIELSSVADATSQQGGSMQLQNNNNINV